MSIFDPVNTAKAVHTTLTEAFTTIPDGRTHVVMIDGTWDQTNGGAARMLYAQKLADGWNVVLEGSVDQPHGLAGRVATMKSW